MRMDSPTGSSSQRACISRHAAHTLAMSDPVMARDRFRTVVRASRNSASASWGTRSRYPSMIFSKQATASDDAIRSLVISYKLLGTREWFVIHHTDCGMLLFTNDDMRSLLASSLKIATLDQNGWRDSGEGPGSTEGSYMGRDEVSTFARSPSPLIAVGSLRPLATGYRVPQHGGCVARCRAWTAAAPVSSGSARSRDRVTVRLARTL
jgi:hypothetical protein